ncbi:MAG: TatD family nuclease-associated radical SAM protein [Firmicutes bacterium]|nr:TatD family nuclease-associated radical SAM protein [Bacillota bacterium]
MNTFVYKLSTSLYINLTNRCSNDCVFCVRNLSDSLGGYDLRLSREPLASEVLNLIEKERDYSEVVFCGYGEPTCCFDTLIVIASALKAQGVKTRLNTNGQANLILKRNVAKELASVIDIISISLNAVSAEKYQEVCKSEFGKDAFGALLSFAKECAEAGAKVILSAVDILSEEEILSAKEIAKTAGAEFRLRALIE